jgi:hypothetical protein
MDGIAAYFAAERAESLLFIAVGVLAIGLALYLAVARRTSFAKGMAVPVIAIAAIQLVVGGTVFVRSPHDTVRVQQALQTDRARIAAEEIPRMAKVIDNFVAYRWVELGLLVLGVALLVTMRHRAFARGTAWGLALQSAFMLTLDFFAEQRAHGYMALLIGL